MADENKVFCVKLNIMAPALARAPFSNDLGERVYKSISQPAWDSWVVQQTKIINELRLDVSAPESQQLLEKHMLDFLFSEKSY